MAFLFPIPSIISKPSYEYDYGYYDDCDRDGCPIYDAEDPEIQQPHFTTGNIDNVTVSLGQNAVLKCEVENLGDQPVNLMCLALHCVCMIEHA